MKIIHLNYSDSVGGAARAVYRIHKALTIKGVDSSLHVNCKDHDDWSVYGPVSKFAKITARLKLQLGSLFVRLLKTGNPIFHSPALFPSGRINALNASDADVLHLHWVGAELLSVSDIGRISKPIVWTLHDMWAFCGAEHVTEDFRWRDGYTRANRPPYETGFDLNRWTWLRKKRHWQHPINIVAPSVWLANCVRQSLLMKDWQVTVIPNPINTELWAPIEKKLARRLLLLPENVPLLLFGAIGGTNDKNKGFDLLLSALKNLQNQVPKLELIVFGQTAPEIPLDLAYPVHYMGHLHDDLTLRAVYSAADLFVNPSRQEAFGQTASEAHACATPVVAFDNSGLADVVKHGHTGYLARAFDVDDLACGIKWVFSNSARMNELSFNARARAVSHFDSAIVAEKYSLIYENAISYRCDSNEML